MCVRFVLCKNILLAINFKFKLNRLGKFLFCDQLLVIDYYGLYFYESPHHLFLLIRDNSREVKVYELNCNSCRVIFLSVIF